MEAAIALVIFLVVLSFGTSQNKPASATPVAQETEALDLSIASGHDVRGCRHPKTRWVERDLTDLNGIEDIPDDQ